MKRNYLRDMVAALVAGSAMLGAAQAGAASYLIYNAGGLPADLAAQVKAAGGSIDTAYPFGVAVARSDSPAFAASITGARVVEDIGLTMERPAVEIALADAGFPPNSGDDDFFFDLQWGHNYVHAQQAWAEGVTGQGVKVAVLDTGFDLDHPDLVPNIDYGLSMDFTGEGLQYTLPDTFSHGTHTAGTIAAADNGFGTIGIAPNADLILVKVLGDAGSGSFADIIAGIYYASSVGADVINMSLGTLIARKGDAPGEAAEISGLANAVSQAMLWARQHGTLVVTSAGNEGHDLDGDGGIVRFNNGLAGAIGISALGPINWAGNPGGNAILQPASYTNYGTSMVEFSAPGGDFIYPGNENCTVAGLTRPCWVFDLVFSTGNGGWYWSAGTSMAAPHAAGIAALIISEYGGNISPAQVEAQMRLRGIDLGKRGADDFYGRGGQVSSGY